ncbi:type II secretion system F family protein [Micromonospora sp. RTP1Z1]|uniref:type II secretion system F family protein n=1 Tax=Micromonospora sp. RTP1Z1 TaxID=2994043 RepID=UPI0029C81384|nr:type II secretion system F family protein [Micromonospora sp. RTP1Z1]
MPRQAFAAGCLVGAALLVIVARAPAVRPGRRLRRLGRSSEGGAERARAPWWPDRTRLGAGLAGVAAAIVVTGWAGLLVAVLVAVAADRLLRRIEPRAVRDRRLRETADLPLAADLLAAALRAGAPVDRSVLAVAEALGGPMADRLGRVGRTLLLGGEPAEAWSQLLPVPGAERLVAAALRSSSSGAALAGALTRLADDLRADRSTAAEAAARRAGVLIVLPLGLCFLPAFILAGLVPVIVAVLGDVL